MTQNTQMKRLALTRTAFRSRRTRTPPPVSILTLQILTRPSSVSGNENVTKLKLFKTICNTSLMSGPLLRGAPRESQRSPKSFRTSFTAPLTRSYKKRGRKRKLSLPEAGTKLTRSKPIRWWKKKVENRSNLRWSGRIMRKPLGSSLTPLSKTPRPWSKSTLWRILPRQTKSWPKDWIRNNQTRETRRPKVLENPKNPLQK